ncbi:MAG: site-specific integrase [Planctomycetota bacterium]|nr:site-specific integrase [Planctomycetota bacterium]
MPMPRKTARLVNWRGEWWIFYRDYTKAKEGKPTRIKCEHHEATNAKERTALLKEYRDKEALDKGEAKKRGGVLAYDASLVAEIDAYVGHLDQQGELRSARSKQRIGLAAETVKNGADTADRFKRWLTKQGKSKLATGELDRRLLERFFDFLATEKTYHGNRQVIRRAATVNKHKRHLRACIGFINDQRPPRFPDFPLLVSAFRATPTDADAPVAFTSKELSGFVTAAMKAEEMPVIEVERKGRDGTKAVHKQSVSARPDTPVSRLFLLLALTGCRLGEALALEWKDVDVLRGRITFYAQKTGRSRIVALRDAPEGEIAPTFADLLGVWNALATGKYVLPSSGKQPPSFSQTAWYGLREKTGIRVNPQSLRQNFTSYAASIGVPPAVAALWQGHGSAVAERFYRAQVLERIRAKSIEAAMGLTPVVEQALQRIEQETGVSPGVR